MYTSVEPTRLGALQLSVTEKCVTVIWIQNSEDFSKFLEVIKQKPLFKAQRQKNKGKRKLK